MTVCLALAMRHSRQGCSRCLRTGGVPVNPVAVPLLYIATMALELKWQKRRCSEFDRFAVPRTALYNPDTFCLLRVEPPASRLGPPPGFLIGSALSSSLSAGASLVSYDLPMPYRMVPSRTLMMFWVSVVSSTSYSLFILVADITMVPSLS